MSTFKLTSSSLAALQLNTAFENGTIPFKSTAEKLRDSHLLLGNALLPYDAKSLNKFLAALRRTKGKNHTAVIRTLPHIYIF